MHLIDFVATEHIEGDMELDFDTTIDEVDAKEMAVKEIAAHYPEYDNIEIIRVTEIG